MEKLTHPELNDALEWQLIHLYAKKVFDSQPRAMTLNDRLDKSLRMVQGFVMEACVMLSGAIDVANGIDTDHHELIRRVFDTMIAWQEEQDPSTRN